MTAGAGSGKTRTLTERVIHLINSDIEPERIVAITFTNKAADEMRSRIVKGVGHANKKKLPYIGTFHAFCARILRKEAKNLGRDHNFGIFDNDDSLRVIKKSINSLGLAENKKVSPALLLKGISNAKMELLTSDSLESPLKEVFEDYETRLQEQNAFDFDDLITKVVELLSDNPAKLKKYQDQFDYILVDEYQDINRAQYVFIKLLSQKHGNINVVGDDQQSIYAFRGANIKTFLDFERDWPGAKIVHLGENYRSTGNIVGAAAKVIENNRLQIRKKLWTQNPGGAPVSVLGTYSAEEEADLIASEITERGFRPSAILYRTNAQSRAIEQSLNFHSIPYEMYGGVKFYDRKEIKDILAPLRYALNPKDQVSRERIEKAFLKKISEKLITELPKMAQTLGLMELIGYILKTTDYFEYLIKKFDNALERTENVRELISFASEFNSLGDFMERVALLNANDSINRLGEKDAPVKLMTIHLAKGLEFDDVYIAGVDDGVLPHHRSFFNEEDIEEERRLMYVAMTRAKENLTLSFHSIASRFLYEMPPELIKFKKAGQFEEETIYLD
ncbi:MAG: ATP-dependent DNA helicase pcra [Parcubacteria group bacterium GW2011_GWA2_46_10]|nr:MAG: ATP-dependent DNA helicase pcra [Parcubacteria group bacterium GW2011_GWA2_46_10]